MCVAQSAWRIGGGSLSIQPRSSNDSKRRFITPQAMLDPSATGNVIKAPQTRELVATSALTKKQLLQMEMKKRLEEEDSWYQDADNSPNYLFATSPTQFKAIVTSSPPSSIVVANFFSPSCHACKSMWPKLKQIAAGNLDVTFIKVNTSEKSLVDLAQKLNISKLPWFMIFQGGSAEILASFTANLSTIDTLRAEIAAAKECTDEHCSTN